MMPSIQKAMILAAGEGTRLQPLTLNTPKTMLPLAGTPLITHIIRWLKMYGITDIGINLHYLGNKIFDYLGDGSQLGINIEYSQEENILGTSGGVKRLEKFFKDSPFVVVYGDVLTDFNLGKMIEYHNMQKAAATIALVRVLNTHEKGIIELNNRGRILSFVEKPAKGTERSHLSNGGIYILGPNIFDYIPPAGFSDFGYDVFPAMLNDGLPLFGYKLESNDYLIDIGSIEQYQQANIDCLAGKIHIQSGPQYS
jgi:NDP-sugar pyrophosphorylase family protein